MNKLSEVSFGEWLKRQRKASGSTQEQLAQQISCSTITLRKIEAEERRPSAQIAERLAQIFNIPHNEQKAFLRFARGNIASAPAESIKAAPWHISNAPARANLPATVTSLIGREQDTARVREYLSDPNIRLITLVGPPGIGKTQLSLEVARRVVNDFPDGIFFVPLAPLADPSLVPPSIIQSLGYVETKKETPIQQLADGIDNKHMLLVLDNCEHMVNDVAPLVACLLSACPRLKVIATSRESMHIPGEWLYTVPVLEVPAENFPVDLESASNFPALTLFAERARAVRSDFALSAENIQAVVSICAKLDGLPLAIELIATRIRLMSPRALLERLSDQFVLSANGMRAVSARQKTLNNAIGWSYNLLSDEEKQLFAHLSVFSGGFTLEAAEAIFSRTVAGKSVPDLINSLLDKSLLQSSDDKRGELRYTMLVTIHEYAWGCLRHMGVEIEARNWHLTYFLNFAERADVEIHSANQVEWLNRMDEEHDNFRAALNWCLSDQKAETALNLAGTLSWFWSRRGYLSEGRNWLERSLAVAKTSVNKSVWAKALYGLAYVASAQGDFTSAQELVRQSISLWRTLGFAGKHGLTQALVLLGNLARDQGDPLTARSLIEESVAISHEEGNIWDLAWSLNNLGMAIRDQEDYGLAQSVIEESVAIWGKQGDLWGLAEALHCLGLVHYRRGDYAMACSVMEEIIPIRSQLGDKHKIAYSIHNLGVFTLAQGDKERAKQFLDQDLALFREVGDRSGLALSLQYQGLFAHLQGNDSQAQSILKEGLNLARETSPKWISSNYLLWLSLIAADRGQFDRATRLFSAAKANLAASASFWDAFEYAYYERVLNLVRTMLDDEAFMQAQAEGQTMTLEQAVEYALEASL